MSAKAIIQSYNGTIKKADTTVLVIMALNRLRIPDVLIDIIKDYLYIDAYTVWRNFSKASINESILSLWYDWTKLLDIQGRVRLVHWAKGNQCESSPIQMQCSVCVSCGESDSNHTNLDGCCGMEGDYHAEGQLLLLEEKDFSREEYDENDDDALSYQYDLNEW